jgi:hypothetical protein
VVVVGGKLTKTGVLSANNMVFIRRNNIGGRMMNIKEFTSKLNGTQYGSEMRQEIALAKCLGFVIVYGHSDDCMEFAGTIDDEVGCYDGETINITADGIMKECEDNCKYYRKALESSREIEAIWCGKDSDGWSWTYKTDIPHETFEMMDDEERYCLGIVFDIRSLEVGK